MTAAERDEQVISLLASLTKASTLANFAVTAANRTPFRAVHVYLAPLAARNQKVLQAWFTALAHGYRLFLAEQQQLASGNTSATVEGLCMLLNLISGTSLFFSPAANKLPQQVLVQVHTQASVLFVRTGLLELTTKMCTALTNITLSLPEAQQQQQQQQQQQWQERSRHSQQQQRLAPDLMVLATSLVDMLSQLAYSWPGRRLFLTPALAPVLPAAAGLAAAVFRVGPPGVRIPVEDGVDTAAWDAAMIPTANFTQRIAETLHCWLKSQQLQGGNNSRLPPDLGVGSRAWELLLIQLAVVVQALHKQLQGLPPGAGREPQRQGVVPAFHQQLLAALGADTEWGLRFPDDLQRLQYRCTFIVGTLMEVMQHTKLSSADAASSTTTTTGSSSAGSSNQQLGSSSGTSYYSQPEQQQQAQQPLACYFPSVLPLHLTVLESMLLGGDYASLYNGLLAMKVLLSRQGTGLFPRLQHLEVELLPVLVQQLLPVVQQADATREAEQAQGEKELTSLIDLLSQVVVILMSPTDAGNTQSAITNSRLLATFRQHTRQFCVLLEASLRLVLRAGCLPDSVIIAHRASKMLFMAGFEGDSATAAAAPGSSLQAADGVQLQLFSLALTCWKAHEAAFISSSFIQGMHHKGTTETATIVYIFTFWPCALAVRGILPLSDCPNSMWAAMKAAVIQSKQQAGVGGASGASCTSNKASMHQDELSSTAAPDVTHRAAAAAADGMVQRWCVLLARCLVCAGKSLQQHLQQQEQQQQTQQQQQEGIADSSTGNRLAGDELECGLGNCLEIVAWLKGRLLRGKTAAATDPRAAVTDESAHLQLPGLQDLLAQAEGLLVTLECCRVELVECEAAQVAATDKMCFQSLRDSQVVITIAPIDAAAAARLAQDAAALAELGQQLEVFGAAVCAQLPVQQCCNYHLCSNAAKHSELELVSGKSCVCGGCRTARYCSSACQKAHWHGWHKAVCTRLKEQQLKQH